MLTSRRAWEVLALCAALQGPGLARGDGNASATGSGRGYLGIQLEPAPGGLRVMAVEPGSPASTAGVQPGDMIIRANGGPPGDPSTFTMSVRSVGVGGSYPLVLLRGQQRVGLWVHLGTIPRLGVTIGSPAPALAAQVVSGPGPANLNALRGRVVLVDFWASWCGPCRMLMPTLDRLHRRFAAQGLTVLGVTDEGASIARSVGAQMSIGYTLARDSMAAARFGVRGLPTTVLIDRSGNVRRVGVGVDLDEVHQIERSVQQLLAEPTPP